MLALLGACTAVLLQVAITDAPVKRGMLLLRPEHVTVLGGEVSPDSSWR